VSAISWYFPEDGREPYFDLRKAIPEQLACVDSLQVDETVASGGEDGGERIINRKIRLTLPKRREMLETIGKHIINLQPPEIPGPVLDGETRTQCDAYQGFNRQPASLRSGGTKRGNQHG
jgi:hypothetical protein